ncbi:MAG: F0F1 ATP synthase subunit B [Bacteroidetes bacterium]|jgi:F-type H+-transporting ATPase subunit b|nr:F0F1 ATP synthase subunit B [Bacteroidota bacterium]MBT6687801.1 F0F1 ATP synthase subunit B [Bacteroidota bacterium]MBT7143470.1 F0F1 ATP synthase subunit B [Bacteroidota bacterium]MBT7493136.1 F0F1 ATP synthase subunit B [Bacteroidota bacterium]
MQLIVPDLGLLFWMLVSFGIVLFVLKKFAWKPILGALKEREDSIESALESAENAKSEMKKLKADNEVIIVQAKEERDNLLKEARDVKESIIKDAKVKATIETDKLIETARVSIQNEKATAVVEIKNQVAELAVEIAEKILKKELADKKSQKEYIKELTENINLN